MSDKTPGQVVFDWMKAWDKYHSPDSWEDASPDWQKHCNETANAICDHVRPQIEREARAAAVEECAQEMDRRSERDRIRADDQTGIVGFGVTAAFAACYNDAAKAIRAISAAPAGFVCVPVEPTEEMIYAADKHSKEWSKTLRPLQPLNEETWRDACIGRYKAMLAAARPK